MQNEVFATVSNLSEFYVDQALQSVMDQLPDDESKKELQRELKELSLQGMNSVINGRGFEQELKQGAVHAAKFTANHYTKNALTALEKKLPSGKVKNVVVQNLQDLTQNGIESICNGANLDDVVNEMEASLSLKTKEYLKSESAKIGASWIDSIAGNFKDKGRGKGRTSKNRKINALTGQMKTNLALNIGENLDALWRGNKDLPTALGDVAFDTAANATVDFVKGQAEELGNKMLKSVSKTVEKEIVKQIEDKTLKGIAKKGLKKIGNIDGLMNLKDVGSDFMQYLDGKIDGVDLVQRVTDKTADAVSTAVEKFVTVLAAETGTAAPVIGYMAGYIAGNLIRGAVAPFLNAARNKKWAKERYEKVHAMSEAAIEQMQEQRRLFEEETAKLLGKRKEVIDNSFNALNQAIVANDVNAASNALNQISKEFGKENKLSTFEEFDDFIMNGEGELTW